MLPWRRRRISARDFYWTVLRSICTWSRRRIAIDRRCRCWAARRPWHAPSANRTDGRWSTVLRSGLPVRPGRCPPRLSAKPSICTKNEPRGAGELLTLVRFQQWSTRRTVDAVMATRGLDLFTSRDDGTLLAMTHGSTSWHRVRRTTVHEFGYYCPVARRSRWSVAGNMDVRRKPL